MESNTNPQVLCTLYAPTSGLTSSYELTFALADHAALNGVTFRINEEVTGVHQGEDGLWRVQVTSREYTCRVVINCAGGAVPPFII